MGCIDPDGTLNVTAILLLKNLSVQPLSPMEITQVVGVPLFMVRGSLRELAELGLIQAREGLYHITDEGRAKG